MQWCTCNMEEKQTHSHQVYLTTDLGDPTVSSSTVPASKKNIPQSAQPSKEAQAAFPTLPNHGRKSCHLGACPSQHLSALTGSSRKYSPTPILSIMDGLPADTADHLLTWPLSALQKNPPTSEIPPTGHQESPDFSRVSRYLTIDSLWDCWYEPFLWV